MRIGARYLFHRRVLHSSGFGYNRHAFRIACIFCAVMILASIGSPADVNARPREVIRIAVDGHALDVETARTPEDRERGLKYRADLCATCGMLFVYPKEGRRSFFTRDVFVALDIAYFGADGRLLEMRTMAPNGGRGGEIGAGSEAGANAAAGESRGPETFPASQPFQYALAAPAGWFANKRIRRYARLSLPRDLPAL